MKISMENQQNNQPSIAELARMFKKGLLSLAQLHNVLMHRLIAGERVGSMSPNFKCPKLLYASRTRGYGLHYGIMHSCFRRVYRGITICFTWRVFDACSCFCLRTLDFGLIGDAFLGLKAAIVVIVLNALIRLAQKSLNKLNNGLLLSLALSVFSFLHYHFHHYRTLRLVWFWRTSAKSAKIRFRDHYTKSP